MNRIFLELVPNVATMSIRNSLRKHISNLRKCVSLEQPSWLLLVMVTVVWNQWHKLYTNVCNTCSWSSAIKKLSFFISYNPTYEMIINFKDFWVRDYLSDRVCDFLPAHITISNIAKIRLALLLVWFSDHPSFCHFSNCITLVLFRSWDLRNAFIFR